LAEGTTAAQEILHDLGDGLVMRRARPEDSEALAHFHASTLLDIGDTEPDERMRAWMLDLMSGEHPTFRPSDFCLVEDARAGKIVSSIGHISQTWTYEGVAFPFGQPEIVSTDPEYRRRGLVRAQFNEVHRWSAARGELVQGITGIPWYYRQFGYEMALNLGGQRVGFKSDVPALKEGEEAYRVRRATVADVPFIMEIYARTSARSMIASVRSEANWRYDIEGRSENSAFSAPLHVIETTQGEDVGVLMHSRRLSGGAMRTYLYEVKAGVPFLGVTPSVMRYLGARGEEYAKRDGAEFSTLAFNLGETHPVYDTVSARLPKARVLDAWYIRVPDLPAFVRHIAPALEKRLADSPQGGYTGELKINFYRSGLHLRFERGSIAAEGWKPDRVEEGEAAFPDLTFLQLLFGYRSLEELEHAFPDLSARTDEAQALLPILFPKKDSNVLAGG
jgi:predicted N-acetyltransferase YhbS